MTKEPKAKENSKELSDQKLKVYLENVKLCRAVEAQPCIYDRSYPQQHKDMHQAWTAIAAACGETVSVCKVRWQNIRYAFMRSLQATNKRQPNRLRNYYLYDVLKFFIPHITANNSSGTEDDVESIETVQMEKLRKSVATNPGKQSGALDEERTTSANESTEEEQRSSTSGTKITDSLFLQKQESGSAFGKETDVNNDNGKVVEEKNKINLEKQTEALEGKPGKHAVKEATATEDAEAETDGRQFRFRRACKRSMDKSMLQQLRSPSPKKEAEPKRTRRSVGARRATLRPGVETTNFVEEATPPNLSVPTSQQVDLQEQIDKETPGQQLKHIRAKSVPVMDRMLPNHSFIPSDIVETQMKPSSAAEQPVLIEWTSTPSSVPFVADSSGQQSCMPFLLPASLLKFDRAVQCDKEIQRSACDDEFLDMLRPQMTAMNARQKLHFKQKIYKSLIEVFDDASNFPNSDEVPSASAFPVPPFPGVSPTTGAEMCLIRELVSLVQAAKLTPELTKPQDKEQNEQAASSSGESTSVATETAKTPTEVAATQTDTPITPPPPVESSKKVVFRSYNAAKEHAIDDAIQRQLMRKVVKVGGLVNTPEGEKRRIYRILPQSGASFNTSQTPSSGVGTFILPRASESNTSTVNTAATPAESSSINSTAFGSAGNVYREIPVSGGTAYVSAAGATGPNGTQAGTRRMMTIRSTVRSSGTCIPRQIVRRYSICGSGNMSSMDNKSSTNINTTPSHENKSILKANPNTSNVRYVRATATATPPFKQPQPPTTTVSQTLTTRTTPSTQLLNQLLPDKPEATPTIPIDVDMHNNLTYSLTDNFNSIFSASSSSTSSAASSPIASIANGKNSSKTTPSQQRRAAKTKDRNLEEKLPAYQGSNNSTFPPNKRYEDTAGVIASDYFGSFNIKSEPLD